MSLFRRISQSQQYFLLTINNMSTSRRAGVRRKCTVVEVETKVECNETAEDNVTITQKVKGRLKRATKPREVVKLEVEHDGGDEDTSEVSKYFSSQEQKADVKVEAVSPVSSPIKTDNETVTQKGKGKLKRAIKPREVVKIEVERDGGEEEDSSEVSKYFVSQEQKAEVKVEASSPVTSPSKKKKSEPLVVEPPENWKALLENIRIMRSTKTAAVDTMGCERTADTTQEPKVQRFHTLISLMLSSQTRDQVTFAAMTRLKEKGLTVQAMLDVNEKELGELIKPVGFYSRKATYIKKVAGILRDKYDDDIPRTIEELCALPGVGPKMAYICMNAAWNENAGIGVDTHVHRISNRLKWTGKKGTSTPEKTREALESWMPKEMWQEINIMLVGFGQEICLPVGPKCSTCLNKDICPSAGISSKKKTKAKK